MTYNFPLFGLIPSRPVKRGLTPTAMPNLRSLGSFYLIKGSWSPNQTMFPKTERAHSEIGRFDNFQNRHSRHERLPWSSGHDFRLSLTPRSAGDRGSIPRGRVSFCLWTFDVAHTNFSFLLSTHPVLRNWFLDEMVRLERESWNVV